MPTPRTAPLAPSPFVAPRLARLARWLPAALAAFGALLPACTPDPTSKELRTDAAFESNRFLRAIVEPERLEDEEPPPVDDADIDFIGGQRHKGEEGRMGKPTSKTKAGLYAMRGPRAAIPQMARNAGTLGTMTPNQGPGASGEPASPGDLTGTIAGEHYAVGGLGLPPLIPAVRGAGHHDADATPWQLPHSAPLSTFSIDVDTASYSNVRRYLTERHSPPAHAVRVEEMINYFDYGYDEPEGPHPLAVGAEVVASPWNQGRQLVRVHLQGETIERGTVPPRNLVFLVDTSGSMSSPDKLPLVQRALELLVDDLRAEDRISLVTYAGSTRVVLQATAGDKKWDIKKAIHELGAGGGTNGGAGIVLAYQEARRSFLAGGINRVMLATDGDFNVGLTGHDEMVALIEKERQTGVFLSVLGVGRGNLRDSMMEQVADHGDGNYAYLDSEREARKVLVREVGGTIVTVARDVKLQVEWNPSRVAAYRLVGYENRTLAAQDFNDDRKDAGELGAGDSVTALYEVIPVGRPVPGAVLDGLKYSRPHGDPELMTVKVRYKRPNGGDSVKLELGVAADKTPWDRASPQTRLAVAVAAFGLKLRDEGALPSVSFAQIAAWAREAELPDPNGDVAEFSRLVEHAGKLLYPPAVEVLASVR